MPDGKPSVLSVQKITRLRPDCLPMQLDSAEIEHSQAARWRLAQGLCVAAPFVLGAWFYAKFQTEISFPTGQFVFALIYSAVNLILARQYLSAYRFFSDRFYYFVSVSWFANAVFVLLDLNGPADYVSNPAYRFAIYLLFFTSDVFLVIALLSIRAKRLALFKGAIIKIVFVGVVCLGVCYSFLVPLTESSARRLAAWMLPGSALSFVLLCGVGVVLKDRFGKETIGWERKTLVHTLYSYAFLQFFFPFSNLLELRGTYWIFSVFLVAQLAKVGNAVAMQGALQSAIAASHAKKVIEKARSDMKVKEAELKAHEASLEAEETTFQNKRQFMELGLLASSIKHDISTPLTAMGFDIQVLKDRYQHNNRTVRKLVSLEESIERIYAIVKTADILRGDQTFFDREEFMKKANMLEIVHRAVRSVKNEKQALKQTNPRDFIKIEGRDLWVRAYSPMFEQLIVNVIKNGLEAIEEAKRERGIIRINVNTTGWLDDRYSRWVRVDIEDNGIGIPNENLNKLTTVFTTRNGKKPNSGIGLFIGRKILDIHGGKIAFESEVGTGTKVTLLLPEWNAFIKATETKRLSSADEHSDMATAPEGNIETGTEFDSKIEGEDSGETV
jgi:signal transduction histidine kinase